MESVSSLSVAIAGQPNTGKSTIFGALTGTYQEVGNWPGKTVEKKQGRAPQKNGGYTVIDLPGSYSLSALSEEERIAVDFLRREAPDLVVVTAGAVSPERTLAYALDIIVMGRPVIIVLNMADIAEANGIRLDVKSIAEALGVPVLLLSAIKKGDVAMLRGAVAQALRGPRQPAPMPEGVVSFLPGPLREAFSACVGLLRRHYGMEQDNAFAVIWQALHGDAKNRALLAAVPEAAGITDQVFSEQAAAQFREARGRWMERLTGRDRREASRSGNRTAVWDAWILHPVWGALSMLFILFFTLAVGFGVGFPLAALTAKLFAVPEPHILAWGQEGAPMLAALTIGAWRGVSSVVAMLPFLVVFYGIFAFLEDVGYMARAAFIMDRAMSRIGLNGKAFIPLLFAVPCNIAGVVGCRTIENPRDRLLTILLIPLVPCTAKIVVMVSIASWLFPPLQAALTVAGLLCMNALVLAAVSLFAGKLIPRSSDIHGLLMELPHFHRPNFRTISRYVARNTAAFLKKASTLIVAFSILLWFVAYYPTAEIESSLLGQFGKAIQPLGDMMGFDWRLLTALLASAVSKEALLATLGIVYEAGPDLLPAILRASVSYAGGVAFMCAQSLFLPCVITLGILYSESRSLKVIMVIVAYTLLLPIIVASLVYHTLMLFG